MDNNVIFTAALALVILGFIFARQLIPRPVTQRSLLLPLLVTVALGGVFVLGHPAPGAVVAVVLGVVLGLGTGLVSGQVIRVWRDDATGVIFQQGGWRYLLVLLAFLLARVLIRFVFLGNGGAGDETALNAALIAALVCNFLGRDIRTVLRALALAGGRAASLAGR